MAPVIETREFIRICSQRNFHWTTNTQQGARYSFHTMVTPSVVYLKAETKGRRFSKNFNKGYAILRLVMSFEEKSTMICKHRNSHYRSLHSDCHAPFTIYELETLLRMTMTIRLFSMLIRMPQCTWRKTVRKFSQEDFLTSVPGHRSTKPPARFLSVFELVLEVSSHNSHHSWRPTSCASF